MVHRLQGLLRFSLAVRKRFYAPVHPARSMQQNIPESNPAARLRAAVHREAGSWKNQNGEAKEKHGISVVSGLRGWGLGPAGLGAALTMLPWLSPLLSCQKESPKEST